MAEEPTYAALKQRVKDLEREAFARSQTEVALREIEEMYHLLTDNANDIIWTLDLNMDLANAKLSYVSPSVERLRGYTAEEALTQGIGEILTPDAVSLCTQHLLETLEKEKGGESIKDITLELEHYCKDGSTVWMECSMSLLHDKKGNPVGIMGVSRDITERKEALENVECVLSAGKRARDLVQQILTFSRQSTKTFSPIQVKFIRVASSGCSLLFHHPYSAVSCMVDDLA